jgi:hypothetical protein
VRLPDACSAPLLMLDAESSTMTTLFKMVVVILAARKELAIVTPSRLHESAKRLT